jgi:ribonuclease H / adenosylcobalamin/alpha-ribazole phosphatase
VTNALRPSLDLPGDDTWVTYSDGAARGNPGPASYGAAVIDPEGVLRYEISEAIGVSTNNVAEYKGLIAALEAALEHGARRVQARLDSELIVKQALGEYRVKHPGLLPLFSRLQALRREFDDVSFRHVPRAQNKLADYLANRALDREKLP